MNAPFFTDGLIVRSRSDETPFDDITPKRGIEQGNLVAVRHDMNETASRQFSTLLFATWAMCLGCVLVLPYVISLNDPGNFLIRNSVRLALLYWAIAVALSGYRSNPNPTHSKDEQNRPRCTSGSGCRVAWTLACIAYLIHVGMAFEHAHHWSHATAFDHVKQASGFGEGIFVSYLFTLIWTLDAAWWWIDHVHYENRANWLVRTIHGFMLFIIVNGTIIFENGPIRWIGAAILLGLGWLFWNRIRSVRRSEF